ncbi:MAG: phosphoglycerate kinase, partial [Candidatus Pacearchaeota archaeon]
DFNFKDKVALLRSDLNSNVVNGKVILSERIIQSVITIKELKKRGAKVVIIAHQGRKGSSDFLSLEQHAKLLNRYTTVRFVKDIVGKEAEREIKNLKSGEALLLENIRSEDDELNPRAENNRLIKLTEWADIYVNDAFSVCHREQTSITEFPKRLPSCAGRLLEKEVNALKKIKIKKCLYILGGAKPEDNIKLLKGNKILSCGLFGQVCLINKGKNLGAQNKYLEKQGVLIKIERSKLRKVITPIDFAVLINGKRREIEIKNFPNEYEIFDIGSKTIKLYTEEIKKAKAIYMKGPAGDCSKKEFCKGTKSILEAVSKIKVFSVIGGGHLSDAIKKFKIDKSKFGHISLSGGALLSYIAGEKLPGLEALK